ncbi:MAG TPA: TolC family protein [Phycisphaerales bacterium]|nr:TolC family protein [Phycisphaerales bacterium]
MTRAQRSSFILRPRHRSAGALLAAAAVLSAGCAVENPLRSDGERILRHSVLEGVERELSDARSQPLPVITDRPDSVGGLNIRPDIARELDAMAGPASYPGSGPLGVDLTGRPVRTVSLSLERCVRATAANNIAVQFARIGPAINEAQIIAAEAAFDWTFFTNLNWTISDAPRVSTTSIQTDESQSLQNQLGLRRQLVGGGRFSVQADSAYQYVTRPGAGVEPNPAMTGQVTAQWDQPLLRNFGSEVSRAEIRLATNAQRTAIQTLRRDLIRVLSDTERTYWQLVRAHQDLQILQRLLERGVRVRDQLIERQVLDANNAQIADARARVERRAADVLRAQTQIRVLSNQLKQLMNDPGLPAGSEIVVLPSDTTVDAPIKFSLLESVSTGVQNRPEVQNAVIDIDDASIRQTVADNLRLPDLSMRLQARFTGIENDLLEAYVDAANGTFIDYLAGLNFELPIGNRRAEADFRRRRLERLQSVLAYRNTVQQVVGEVKGALERVQLNYALIGQTASSRYAAADSLRVLEVQKEQGEGFTVERLAIELDRQESLAAAERGEAEALAEYSVALTDLFAAMGTTMERANVEFVVPSNAPEGD